MGQIEADIFASALLPAGTDLDFQVALEMCSFQVDLQRAKEDVEAFQPFSSLPQLLSALLTCFAGMFSPAAVTGWRLCLSGETFIFQTRVCKKQ